MAGSAPKLTQRNPTKQRSLETDGKWKWKLWARSQGLGVAFMLFLGGIIGLFYPKNIHGILNIATSLIMLLLEYPVPFIEKLGFFADNLYLRAFLYTAFLVPTMLVAPTQSGGFCLFFCILTYLRAAINGETGIDKKPSNGPK